MYNNSIYYYTIILKYLSLCLVRIALRMQVIWRNSVNNTVNLVPRAHDPLGRETKGSELWHNLFVFPRNPVLLRRCVVYEDGGHANNANRNRHNILILREKYEEFLLFSCPFYIMRFIL